jgi:prophage tail gpP-like protein
MTAPIVLLVNGKRYTGWESLELQRSLEATAGGFNATVTNKYVDKSQYVDIQEWDAVKVLLHDQPILDGYVVNFSAGFDVNDRKLTISGFDGTRDLACSAVVKQWKNAPTQSIIEDLLAPFNIPLIVETDLGQTNPSFATEPGDSVIDALKKLSEAGGFLLFPNGIGGLRATRPNAMPETVALVEGQNLKVFSANHSAEELYSSIEVRGQQQGTGRANNGASAIFLDANVPRYRPLILTAKGQAGIAHCLRQANWERANRNGKALTATATLKGWRQGETGKLWDINQRVQVQAPSAFVEEALIIQAITYKLDGGSGTICELQLVREEALLPEPSEAPPAPKRKRGRKPKKKKPNDQTSQRTISR